ncbi:MAG: metallophosphoesterase family protein [Streptosporangiaceae bacterium]
MICCRPNRRELLRWSAVVAGAALLQSSDLDRAHAAARRAGPDAVLPVDLELVTLTETSAVLTWYTGIPGTDDGLGRMIPAPADAEVRFGTRPGRLNRVARGPDDTPYHYVEITGLEPGERYYYEARSRGRTATPTSLDLVAGNAAGTWTPSGAYGFTTPQPPPGRFLFSLALCNDLHLGETVAGLVGGIPAIKGISQVPGHPPYPEIMATALVDDARSRGAAGLLAAGDVTSEGAPADVGRARQLLDRFGTLGTDYLVTRGNHDRAHDGQECSAGQWQGNDCFRDGFFPAGGPAYFARELRGLRIIGLDTYDKKGGGGDAGGLSAEQLDWFTTTLTQDRDRPTLVFGHHPLFVEASPLAVTGQQSLEAGQALSILAGYARTPGVFLHHAGHTHRNRRAVFPLAPHVTHQEVSAVKEYPGGFALLRVHEGGYALNYYKTRDRQAREWSERSRQELAGFWPQLSLGARISDRNVVVKRDFSGLDGPL